MDMLDWVWQSFHNVHSISKHQIVHLKYIQFLFVDYVSIMLSKINKQSISPEGCWISPTAFPYWPAHGDPFASNLVTLAPFSIWTTPPGSVDWRTIVLRYVHLVSVVRLVAPWQQDYVGNGFSILHNVYDKDPYVCHILSLLASLLGVKSNFLSLLFTWRWDCYRSGFSTWILLIFGPLLTICSH